MDFFGCIGVFKLQTHQINEHTLWETTSSKDVRQAVAFSMFAYNTLFPGSVSAKPNADSLPLPSPRLLLSCAAPNKQQTAVTELHPSTWKFPQRQIIKSDFPALLSDVMPLWVWVNSRGLYKEERMYLKCHPAAGARLCYSPPHMCAAEADIRSLL